MHRQGYTRLHHLVMPAPQTDIDAHSGAMQKRRRRRPARRGPPQPTRRFHHRLRHADLDAGARFWSRALGLEIVDPDSGGTGRHAEVGGVPGNLRVEAQKVEHASRVHLDIEADDIDAGADRLEKLGARRVGYVQRWWVMESPTGQRFCVVRMR